MSPRPDLRASDTERERVARFLRDQAAEGRLDHEELEERVGRAYAAKTVRQLQELIADLPRAPLPRARQRRAPVPARRGMHPLLPIGILGFLALGGPGLVWAAAAVSAALAFAAVVTLIVLGAVMSPFLIVLGLIILALRRRRPPRRYGWDPRWR